LKYQGKGLSRVGADRSDLIISLINLFCLNSKSPFHFLWAL
jgi:hypothetical protein